MTWYAWLLIGILVGYIINDLLTKEYVSNIKIGKVKSKGSAGDLRVDPLQEVKGMKERTSIRDRLKARKARRKSKK